MGRPRSEVRKHQVNVGLQEADFEWVERRAYDLRRTRPAVVAQLVTRARLLDAEEPSEEHVLASPLYQQLAREKQDLAERLAELRRQLAALRKSAPAEDGSRSPRWAWPLSSLLADEEWWDAWLPRLHELLGKPPDVAGTFGGTQARRPPADRGYVDLMGYLFPWVAGLTWRSPAYREAVAAESSETAGGFVSVRPGRAEMWEPVIRHVARALAALEAAEQPETDPIRAIQVQAEITGPWVAVLRGLLGEPLLPELGQLAPGLAR